jgi:hypothetical protein
MNAATQNKRDRRFTTTSSSRGGERGIRTPGPDFSGHGISSTDKVGCSTVGEFRRLTCRKDLSLLWMASGCDYWRVGATDSILFLNATRV